MPVTAALAATALAVTTLAAPTAAESVSCQGDHLAYVPIRTEGGDQVGELSVFGLPETGQKCAVTTAYETGSNAWLYVSLGVCAEKAAGDTCTVTDFYEAAAGRPSVETLPLSAAGNCVQAVASITIGDAEARARTEPAAFACA